MQRRQVAAVVVAAATALLGATGTGGALASAAAAVADSSNATWTQVAASAPWQPRTARNVVSLNGALFLLGGANDTDALADVWSSSDGGVTWVAVNAGAAFGARYGACAAAGSGSMMVAGGLLRVAGAAGSLQSDVWSSADGVTWQLVGDSEWAAREGHTCAYFNGYLWVLGGFTPAATATVYYSTAGASWTPAPTAPWAARGYLASTVFEGHLWISGGSNLATLYDDVWTTSDGANWVKVTATAPWRGRDSHCFLPYAGVLWVAGGRVAAAGAALPAVGDVWRTDTTGTQWEMVEEAAAWPPRYNAGCFHAGAGGVWIVGGAVATASPDGGAATVAVVNDGWASTANLLCEDNALVCSTHGTCTPPARALAVTGVAGVAGVAGVGGGVAPFPINCTCAEGWAGIRCAQMSCNPKICAHGTCETINTTAGGVAATIACVCTDPSQWTGQWCDRAVCAPGCSAAHGSCADAPGTCACAADWTGALCTLPDTWLRQVGQWVEARVPAVYMSLTLAGVAAVAAAAVAANVRHTRRLASLGKGGAALLSFGGDDGEYHSLLAASLAPSRSRFGDSVMISPATVVAAGATVKGSSSSSDAAAAAAAGGGSGGGGGGSSSGGYGATGRSPALAPPAFASPPGAVAAVPAAGSSDRATRRRGGGRVSFDDGAPPVAGTPSAAATGSGAAGGTLPAAAAAAGSSGSGSGGAGGVASSPLAPHLLAPAFNAAAGAPAEHYVTFGLAAPLKPASAPKRVRFASADEDDGLGAT